MSENTNQPDNQDGVEIDPALLEELFGKQVDVNDNTTYNGVPILNAPEHMQGALARIQELEKVLEDLAYAVDIFQYTNDKQMLNNYIGYANRALETRIIQQHKTTIDQPLQVVERDANVSVELDENGKVTKVNIDKLDNDQQ